MLLTQLDYRGPPHHAKIFFGAIIVVEFDPPVNARLGLQTARGKGETNRLFVCFCFGAHGLLKWWWIHFSFLVENVRRIPPGQEVV